MRDISWKRIAFWVALWWFIYSAPTEDPFERFRGSEAAAEQTADLW